MMRTRLLIAGVFAALLGVYVLVSGAVSAEQAEIRQELAVEHELLMDYERFVARSDDAQAELEGLRNELDEIESYLFSESNSTPAFARLQMEIQDAAGSAGLSVTSLRPLDTKEFDEYRELSMQVEGRGNIIQVGNFLRKLDSLSMLVGMEELSLTFTGDDGLRMKSVVKGLATASAEGK